MSDTLKKIENRALQAIQALTILRTSPGATTYNIRNTANLFRDVARDMHRHADLLESGEPATPPIADNRPIMCAMRLRDSGRPYPRSGCNVVDCTRIRSDHQCKFDK